MRNKGAKFWSGFACGAVAIVGGALVAERFRTGGSSRILRLERSIQIASPMVTVWDAWSDFDALPAICPSIRQARTFGNRSRWTVDVRGVAMTWEAEITQIVPYQAIGWKSVSGPRHSGRITFTALGNDTLMHVQMNYAPPMRLLRPALAPFSGEMEGYIEKVLREFKAGLEKRKDTSSGERNKLRDTGTHGPGPGPLTETQRTRFGGLSAPVEGTLPPEAKR